MATKSIDTTKAGKVLQNGNAATSAGSKDPMPKPSASNEKDKQEAAKKVGKSKSVMKPPSEPPLQEQPTQRPTVKEVKTGQKDGKPAANGQKGDKNHKPNKSLRVEQTQMGSVKGLSGSDDCTEKCGTPELVLDRTQRSVSVKLADDEDTNENIDELPMDDHLSE
uniref:PEST proteolytic signal-containing nuclear protein n=1 Tax=Panagrellus redivivus TaxID=6233 RepID=A0A7E4ZW70_PANRE